MDVAYLDKGYATRRLTVHHAKTTYMPRGENFIRILSFLIQVVETQTEVIWDLAKIGIDGQGLIEDPYGGSTTWPITVALTPELGRGDVR